MCDFTKQVEILHGLPRTNLKLFAVLLNQEVQLEVVEVVQVRGVVCFLIQQGSVDKILKNVLDFL